MAEDVQQREELVFVLLLNDMRFAKFEWTVPVARASSEEALRAWMLAETVAPYRDEVGGRSWGKTFRKGGPLEWYNAPVGGIGGITQVIANAAAAAVPEVPRG